MRAIRFGRRSQKIANAILALCASAVLTGCDYNDIDHLYIATGMGVDELDHRIRVAADLIHSGAAGNSAAGQNEGEGTAPDRVVSADGATFEQALGDIQAKLSHFLYLQHNALVLFSEEALRGGFAPIADALERNRQLRRSQLWVVTPGRP